MEFRWWNSIFSAWEPLIEAIGIEERLRTYLPFYMHCLVQLELVRFSKAPIHISKVEKDDWVTTSACEDLVQDLVINGVDIGINVY